MAHNEQFAEQRRQIEGVSDNNRLCQFEKNKIWNFIQMDSSLNRSYGNEDVVFWGNLDINFIYRSKYGKLLYLQWCRGRSSTAYGIYLMEVMTMTGQWKYKTRNTPLANENGE